MKKRSKSIVKLNTLPANPTGPRKVRKPRVTAPMGTQFSQRGAKARVDISVPGVKTI